MGIIKWGDIVFLVFVVLAPIVLVVLILFARRKGWIDWKKLSWRETENYIRRSRNTRRRAGKDK